MSRSFRISSQENQKQIGSVETPQKSISHLSPFIAATTMTTEHDRWHRMLDHHYFGQFLSLIHKGRPVKELRKFVAKHEELFQINQKDSDGWTALHHACYTGRLTDHHRLLMIKYLVCEAKAHVLVPTKDGHSQTPLHLSCKMGSCNVVQYLLWSTNARKRINRADTKDGSTPLHTVIRFAPHQKIEIAKLLMQFGANTNALDEIGASPLFYACYRAEDNCLEICRLLVEEGNADPMVGNEHSVPFVKACEKGLFEVVKFFLQQGRKNVDDTTHEREAEIDALHAACKRRNVKIVELLVKEGGISVEHRNKDGETALLAACGSYMTNLDVVRYLIESAGANVHARNNFGWNSLLLAACEFNAPFDVFRYLVSESGALLGDVNTTTGRNVLHEACGSICHELDSPYLSPYIKQKIDYLMTHKAGRFLIQKTDNDGRTPLHDAAKSSHIWISRCLLAQEKPALSHSEKRKLFKTCDKQGYTPLFTAIVRQNYDAAQYFVDKHGANANDPSRDAATAFGDTALHVAIRRAMKEIVDVENPNFLNDWDEYPAWKCVHVLVERGHANIAAANHIGETCIDLVKNEMIEHSIRPSLGLARLLRYLETKHRNRVHSFVHYLNSTFDWFHSRSEGEKRIDDGLKHTN